MNGIQVEMGENEKLMTIATTKDRLVNSQEFGGVDPKSKVLFACEVEWEITTVKRAKGLFTSFGRLAVVCLLISAALPVIAGDRCDQTANLSRITVAHQDSRSAHCDFFAEGADDSQVTSTGACCHSGGYCFLETVEQCVANGGYFQGVGSDCASQSCSDNVKLIPSDSSEGDRFGGAVSINGEVAVVGAPRNGEVGGAAYIFGRDHGGVNNWGQITKISKPDTFSDGFGKAVAVENDTLVIGGILDVAQITTCSAYVFDRNQGGSDNWGQVIQLVPADLEFWYWFGRAVGVSADTVIVGAPHSDAAAPEAGAAYIFYRNLGGADNWGEMTKILPPEAVSFDHFGQSVAVLGDVAVVGAYQRDTNTVDSGAAYLFYRDEGGADNWGQIKKLTAQTSGDAHFGQYVAIDGDIVVIGAPWDDITGDKDGSAYVFQRDAGGPDKWGEVRRLLPPDGTSGDRFGSNVSISGDTIVVGAHEDGDGGIRSGSAYVFRRHEGGADNWGFFSKLIAADAEAYDAFGNAVTIDNDVVVIGAQCDDDYGPCSGSAYVYSDLPATSSAWVFSDDFESGDTSRWSVSVP